MKRIESYVATPSIQYVHRTELLKREAAELTTAFAQNRFKGYQLLKKQHRKRSKPIKPPEHEFTAHYRQHYQLGPEEPITLASTELQPSANDDVPRRFR